MQVFVPYPSPIDVAKCLTENKSNMAKEIWKVVPTFPNYEASSLGRVRLIGGYREFLNPLYRSGRDGRINLYKDGNPYFFRINEIISLTFLGPKPDGCEIIYRNGDTTDNSITNIYYGNLSIEDAKQYLNAGWRWVVGYEGLYVVSRYGIIRSLSRRAGQRIIKGSILIEKTIKTYQTVTLTKDGKSHRVLVHRIVANAFINNPHNYPCINHKDEDKRNNRADNLEWCTHAYNNAYGTHTQRTTIANSFPVIVFYKDGTFYGEFTSCASAGKHFGTNSGMVCRWIKGTRNNHDGFIFKYKYNGGKKPCTL